MKKRIFPLLLLVVLVLLLPKPNVDAASITASAKSLIAKYALEVNGFFTKLARLICIKRHELFGSIKISPQLCTKILFAKKL